MVVDRAQTEDGRNKISMAQIEFGAQKQELLVFWDGLTTRVRAKVHQDALQHLVYFVHIRKKRKKPRREKIVGLIFFYLFIIKLCKSRTSKPIPVRNWIS